MKYTFHYLAICPMCSANLERSKTIGKRMNGSQGFFPRKMQGISVSIVECSNCKIVFPNPMPYPTDINAHYDVRPEDYWNVEYFKDNAEYFKPELGKLKHLAPRIAGKALDIGTGLGKTMSALIKEGFDCYGVEPSKQFINKAAESLKEHAAKIQHTTIENAVFEINTFDFITFGAVLEHLVDPGFALKKALEWLKPGGIIHIDVPHRNWLMAKLVNSFYWPFSDYVINTSPMHKPYHLFEFTPQSFSFFAKANHAEILAMDIYAGPFNLKGFTGNVARKVMNRMKMGDIIIVWLQKN